MTLYWAIHRPWNILKFGIFICFRAIAIGWKEGQLKTACFYFGITSTPVELGAWVWSVLKRRKFYRR